MQTLQLCFVLHTVLHGLLFPLFYCRMSIAQHVPFAAVVIEDLSCTAFFASDLTMMVSVSHLDDFCLLFLPGADPDF